MLFPSIYGTCVEGRIFTEDRMTEILSKLKKETPDHPNYVFRAPITLGHWSKDKGPLEFTKTDRASIRELYGNLLEKITFPETRPSRACLFPHYPLVNTRGSPSTHPKTFTGLAGLISSPLLAGVGPKKMQKALPGGQNPRSPISTTSMGSSASTSTGIEK